MKIGSALKKLLNAVAPVIGSAIGGPVGGAALTALSETLTGKPDANPNDIEKLLLSASPETLATLKAADQAFQEKMAAIGVDLEKLAAEDRASARAMQVQNKSWVVPALASFTVFAFFSIVAWVMTGKVSLDSTLLGFVLGQVSAKAEQVYNFFFGSSEGSKRKTEQLGIHSNG